MTGSPEYICCYDCPFDPDSCCGCDDREAEDRWYRSLAGNVPDPYDPWDDE